MCIHTYIYIYIYIHTHIDTCAHTYIKTYTLHIILTPNGSQIEQLTFTIWTAYLLADWVASFAVGVVFDSEEKYTSGHDKVDHTGLLMLWAPFIFITDWWAGQNNFFRSVGY